MAETHVPQTVQPAIGLLFESFEEFSKFLLKYQQQEKQVFTIKDSRRISDDRLKYSFVNFCCKFGGRKARCESVGIRNTSTFKVDCCASIKLRPTPNKTHLKIVSLNLEHVNHPNSKDFYELIPENRKLSPAAKATAVKALELRVNPKLLQNKIVDEDNKFVTMKDLSNLRSQTKSNENDLATAVQILKDEYGAKVSLLHENSQFKGIYFTTQEMRSDMASWPEIVFVDGTYKLLNLNLTTIIFLVEDGNGRGQIAAVGLLATEEEHVLHWLVKTFREDHDGSTDNIKCFMTDKDLVERNVLRNIFPNRPLYLCLFHTLRTFSRAISTEKMKISKEQREISLQYLQKLAYSSSEELYGQTYKAFSEAVPFPVLQYFNDNWHRIKEEWTVFNMTEGNLLNLTNNRLESLNGKLKQVIQKNSSLVAFIKSFFKWNRSHRLETKYRTASNILKRPMKDTNEDDQKFAQILTKAAYGMVNEQMKLHDAITFIRIDTTSKTAYTNFKGSEIKTEPGYCDCPIWKSSKLPCRHIFAVRKFFGFQLFARELCALRWTKDHALANLRCNQADATHTEITDLPMPSISRVTRTGVLTVPQKRKMLAPDVAELLHLGSLACGSVFEERKKTLENIINAWRQGLHVEISTNAQDSIGDTTQTNSTENIPASSTIANDTITTEEIKMPRSAKIIGHPSGYLKTAVTIKRKSEPRKTTSKRPATGRSTDC